MKNFYLRLLSSLIIAPIFLYALYEASLLFYIILLIIFFVCCYEIFNNVKQKILSFFLYILISFFIFALLKVREIEYSRYIYLIWILSIVWISDIFGYLVGKIIGGPKLSKFSPNKTISGFMGSIFFSQFAFLIPLILIKEFILNFKILLLQFLLCIVSVLGDIFFSYIKRINNIKDYSAFIPGHGGVLDRIDGMIFVIIFYYFIIIFNVI